MEPVVDRNTHISENVVFVDGLTGTGKTMIGPILSSFERVEVQRLEHIYQYVCSLKFLSKIEDDAAIQLLQMYVDLACYNVMIGREANFRWKDLSGVLSNPGGWKYVRRLFLSDGDAVMGRIDRDRPIVHIGSQQLLVSGDTLLRALGRRLTIIEMVRDPLFLLQHWYSIIDRLGTDSRDFNVWINHNGQHLPWFAYGWENEYLQSNKMDRVINVIARLMMLTKGTIDGLTIDQRDRVLLIPFERFVINPMPYIERVQSLVGTKTGKRTKTAMKKEKVPRTITTDGRDLQIYRRYLWQPPSNDTSESAEIEKRWEAAAKEASNDGMRLLNKMRLDYQDYYLSDLSIEKIDTKDCQG